MNSSLLPIFLLQVSTDYDTSSRLYFEPLTLEDVLNVVENERPDGIIVQFGGQTPLKLAKGLQDYITANPIPCASGDGNVRIWGTQPESIDAAEDREQWIQVLTKLNIDQPPGGTAVSEEEALVQAQKLGYPVMVRPSYVLGGRAMRIVYSDEELKEYIETAVEVDPSQPVLVDKYLKGAVEMDVDCLTDKDGNVVIAGIMEHIEEAGVHSGDSACMIPTQTVRIPHLCTPAPPFHHTQSYPVSLSQVLAWRVFFVTFVCIYFWEEREADVVGGVVCRFRMRCWPRFASGRLRSRRS
jgi:carbamoyl-phosphate synthase large subunit